MDYLIEQRFVNTFVRKNRRERLLHELTVPEKRYRGVSRFCHQAEDFLDPSKIVMRGEDLDRRTAFARFVRQHGELCCLLSPDGFLDGQLLPAEEAVRQALMCPEAVVIMGNGFAVVFGEPMKDGRVKFLLSEV